MIVSSIPYQLDGYPDVAAQYFYTNILRWCWLLFYVYEFWKTEDLDLKLKQKKNATFCNIKNALQN